MSKISAIILAAGKGSRMKSDTKKQFMEIKGKPVIWYSLFAFDKSRIDEIILVTGEDDIEYCKEEIIKKYNFSKNIKVVAGGNERYESVYNGLKETTGEIILIHDGARPMVSDKIIENCIAGAMEYGACAAGVKVKDTIKIADESGVITETPNRDSLWITQTPQSFKSQVVVPAYEEMKERLKQGDVDLNITDDAMVVEHFGKQQVRFVNGEYSNIKVTTPEDILAVEAFIS